MEQAINVLLPEGQLGLVVPNRLYRNKSGAPVRGLISRTMQIDTVVDFGSTKPFDADAYIGCIIAWKHPKGVTTVSGARLNVIEVRSLAAEFMADLLLSAGEAGQHRGPDVLRAFEARHPTGDGPWILLSESDQVARIATEDVSLRLDTIAAIPQGIRTGGNDLFVLNVISDDGASLARVVNGLGEEFIVESRLIEQSVYGSQVRRYQVIDGAIRLLYPYRNGQALSEGELERDFPHTWSYLLRNRDLLSSRASLKKSGGRFYELVWPRDEKWLRRPKLMIRDLAPATSFAVDNLGRVFLVGGTAVVPDDPQLLYALLAYLNSSFVNSLVVQTTPSFRGGFQKFEPQHIQGIPVLDRMVEDEGLVEQLTALAQAILETNESSEARRVMEARVDDLIYSVAKDRGIVLSEF